MSTTTIKPTVGRVVLVFFAPAASGAMEGYALPTTSDAPVPGLVTRVHSDSCINVAAFDANGANLPLMSVPLLQDGDKRPTSGCWAEWMPYQKQQAEKQANQVDQLAAHAKMIKESGWQPGDGAGQQTGALIERSTRAGWAGTGLDFGTALLALKDGKRVARAGWNGKGMFVYLVPANAYPAQTGAAKAHFGEGALVPYNAYLALKGADDTVSTWAPSGSDALAEDWHVINDVAHAMEAGRRAAIENFGR